jgi:hypothetical protein
MRTRTVLSAALFAITTAFLAAPSAMAGYTEIKVDTKGPLTPSRQVQIKAMCYTEVSAQKVVSDALDPVSLPASGTGNSTSYATTRIKANLKPGTYKLSFLCADQEVSNTFKVVAVPVKPAPKTASTQVAQKPKDAPETGGGQEEEPMADVVEEEDPIQQDAAPAQSPDSNVGVVALGGAGVLAAGGAGFLLLRRSRRRA